jgi:hypothetical protein
VINDRSSIALEAYSHVFLVELNVEVLKEDVSEDNFELREVKKGRVGH